MAVMEKLKMFVVQEPVVAASCLIAGFGLFLPAVVRPMLDSYQATKQPPQPALSDVSVAFDTNFVILFSNPSSWINIYNILFRRCHLGLTMSKILHMGATKTTATHGLTVEEIGQSVELRVLFDGVEEEDSLRVVMALKVEGEADEARLGKED
ncbi:60S ribosomal protein L28 [Spatholobus suberectus]|nr:60S ribosomal protein L28 [Spatholobus suberectus]